MDLVNYELRITNYELRIMNYGLGQLPIVPMAALSADLVLMVIDGLVGWLLS